MKFKEFGPQGACIPRTSLRSATANAHNFMQELAEYNHSLRQHGLKSEIPIYYTSEQHETFKQNLLI